MELLLEQVKELGGKVVPGASFDALLYSDDRQDVHGVRIQDGQEFFADKIIIATGSWTPSILGSLLPSGLITATGQTIACIQLTEELRQKYEHIPVTMNLGGSGSGGGFYSFPVRAVLRLDSFLGADILASPSPRQTVFSNVHFMPPASLPRMECPRQPSMLRRSRSERRKDLVSANLAFFAYHSPLLHSMDSQSIT